MSDNESDQEVLDDLPAPAPRTRRTCVSAEAHGEHNPKKEFTPPVLSDPE